ncbi:unnamed protein product [marine sediment metagenome]|uniref:3-hydroxyacyl-CoA dehydrogenase NAD binding domain-containing protein n=1 Tax=marine sediment metagenome TaxID=412755 RepID=X0UYV9_9ZZZZ
MDIRRVACIGGGLIGQGWTTLFSTKGLEVVLQDASKAVLEASVGYIKDNLEVPGGKRYSGPG